tara:strand:- start:1618 stop:1950 length:333 start_codon:yes stop_codon:yes gene_type:complete
MTSIRAAQSGSSGDIKFYGKKVYHGWDRGDITINDLGLKLMKDIWIKQNIKDPSYYSSVESMLTDWKLYENGWYISKYDNKHLFYYKTQMGNYGSNRPRTLDCLKKYTKN